MLHLVLLLYSQKGRNWLKTETVPSVHPIGSNVARDSPRIISRQVCDTTSPLVARVAHLLFGEEH